MKKTTVMIHTSRLKSFYLGARNGERKPYTLGWKELLGFGPIFLFGKLFFKVFVYAMKQYLVINVVQNVIYVSKDE